MNSKESILGWKVVSRNWMIELLSIFRIFPRVIPVVVCQRPYNNQIKKYIRERRKVGKVYLVSFVGDTVVVYSELSRLFKAVPLFGNMTEINRDIEKCKKEKAD